MTKTFRVVAILAIWSLFVLCLLNVAPQAQAQNGTADPNAVYGHCWEGVHGLASAFHSKANHIFAIGRGATMANLAGIVVLECREFDGGGGSQIVDCPPGTPYSYCILNTNDGLGNHVLLGVFELDSTTDPNAQYGGCAAGSGFREKSALILEVVKNIRDVNAIVVTACRGFDGPGGTFQVPCPKGSFYTACFKNENDGVGNHVEFGVIKSFGSSDPVGQYGGFSLTNSGKYRPKSAMVTDVGRSLDKVIGINVLMANEDTGGGTRIIDCPYQSEGQTYTYCIHTAGDATGDSVDVGVTERP